MYTCSAHQDTAYQASAWPLMVNIQKLNCWTTSNIDATHLRGADTGACQQTFEVQGSFSAASSLANQPSANKQHAQAGAAS